MRGRAANAVVLGVKASTVQLSVQDPSDKIVKHWTPTSLARRRRLDSVQKLIEWKRSAAILQSPGHPLEPFRVEVLGNDKCRGTI